MLAQLTFEEVKAFDGGKRLTGHSLDTTVDTGRANNDALGLGFAFFPNFFKRNPFFLNLELHILVHFDDILNLLNESIASEIGINQVGFGTSVLTMMFFPGNID